MRRLPTLALAGLVLLVSLAAARASAGESGSIERLKPGEWMEVPDSKLLDVRFKWPKGSYYTQNGIGFKAIIGGWSGGAYDTRRDRLLVWGGGHFAYGGNEIYGFDVNKLKWERLSDPSLKTDKTYPNGGDKYADGLPRSCHSYGYIQYVPALDRFMSFGTTANFPKSRGGSTVWAFDFEKRKWEQRGSTIAGGIGAYSAVDPVTGHVFARGNMKGARLGEWDPETGKWTDRTGRVGHRTDYQKTADIDPVGRRFVAVGGKGAAKYDVKKFEIGKEGRIKQDQLTTKGPQDAAQAKNPGFQYDPVLDKFVGWKGGADFYLLDPVTWTWEKRTPAASNRVTPTKPDKNGTFGRFRYIPSKNAYIVVNNVKENVFIGRLSDRATAPIPERFVAALKSGKDTRVVAWVAGQVAKWPKEKAEPVLKAALSAQGGPVAEAINRELKQLN
jgi:hypothetical protein